MAVLLVVAAAGAVIRRWAPDGSLLQDVGTLMLVMWLPAVGNLVGYLYGKLPRAAPPPTHFPEGAAFTPHWEVSLERLPLPPGFLQGLTDDLLGTVLVGRHGFSVRFQTALRAWLAGEGDTNPTLEFLRPASARGHLQAGTAFYLLAGKQVVAKGFIGRQCG
jgi:hypothetical protein